MKTAMLAFLLLTSSCDEPLRCDLADPRYTVLVWTNAQLQEWAADLGAYDDIERDGRLVTVTPREPTAVRVTALRLGDAASGALNLRQLEFADGQSAEAAYAWFPKTNSRSVVVETTAGVRNCEVER